VTHGGRPPHARAPGHPAGGKSEIGTHPDQCLLQAPNVVDDVDVVGKRDDRVPDQLARPVERDLAPPVDIHYRRAVRRPLVHLGPLPGREDGRMLQQQKRVGDPAGHPQRMEPTLLGPGRLIAERPRAEPEMPYLQPSGPVAHPSRLGAGPTPDPFPCARVESEGQTRFGKVAAGRGLRHTIRQEVADWIVDLTRCSTPDGETRCSTRRPDTTRPRPARHWELVRRS